MPGFATHYLFGVSTVKACNKPATRKLIKQHYHAYSLGLQGPDIFFYYLPVFLRKQDNPGSIAHNHHTKAFLNALADSCELFETKKKKEIALTYYLGFIGHYTLDTICHPYIYYKTHYDEEDKTYFGRHVYLETDIDARLLQREKQLLPSEFRQDRTIRLSHEERIVIAKCLHHAYQEVFPELHLSYLDMYLTTVFMPFGVWFLRDRHGKKKVLFRAIEKYLLGYAFISPMIPSDRLHFTSDPLNLAHKKWYNPWHSSQTFDTSFDDLLEQARQLYLKRIDELMQTGRLSDLENLSFSSGLPII